MVPGLLICALLFRSAALPLLRVQAIAAAFGLMLYAGVVGLPTGSVQGEGPEAQVDERAHPQQRLLWLLLRYRQAIGTLPSN